MPVLPRVVAWSLDMWVAMHEDQRANRRLRLVFDRLATALKSQVNAPAPGEFPQMNSPRTSSVERTPRSS